jgi:hypothetical protein
MKSVLKITTSFLVLFGSVTTIDSSAIAQPSHTIGFIKAKKETGIGPVWYWLTGSNMKDDNVVFYQGYYQGNREATLINVDSQDISLKQISIELDKKSGLIKIAQYKSKFYRVKLKNFKDITTAKEKKNCGRRVRGLMEISGDDGWRKKLQIESLEDVCG